MFNVVIYKQPHRGCHFLPVPLLDYNKQPLSSVKPDQLHLQLKTSCLAPYDSRSEQATWPDPELNPVNQASLPSSRGQSHNPIPTSSHQYYRHDGSILARNVGRLSVQAHVNSQARDR